MSNKDARPTIVRQHVLAFLKKGYTRYAKDDVGYGSIQAHYGLTGVEVKELFQDSKLKARKTILPKAGLNIIDEEEMVETEAAEPTPMQDDVTGLEVAKVVVEELERLSGKAEPAKEVSKEELFS